MKTIKVNKRSVQLAIPVRKKDDNKTFGGKCLIIAGSKSMFGAGVLSAKSAYRVGAGYVYLYTDSFQFPVHKYPEFLVLDYHRPIKFNNFSSIGLGPGLGTSKFAKKLLVSVLKSKFKSVVLDADGLNLLSKMNQQSLPKDWILTPHEGEAARLLKTSSEKVRDNRILAARELYKRFRCVVLLKGLPTLICYRSKIYVIDKGNVALAKAGTGDVLTGAIAGLLSQGLSSKDAAILAAYLHGTIADEWIRKSDYLSLTASDIVERIPGAIKSLRKK